MRIDRLLIALMAAAMSWALPAGADWTEARCDVYPAGEDHTTTMIPCTFSQRQGYITISRSDGRVHELAPEGGTVGNFLDQEGRKVFRQGDLGDQGLIFRFPDESIYLYWDTSALEPAGPDHPAQPFSNSDYDATTVLRCRSSHGAAPGDCPAGILRMEDGQASVVVQSPRGETFTINFMTDYVNASNREVEAVLEGDTWIVSVKGGAVYEVPRAAIEGG